MPFKHTEDIYSVACPCSLPQGRAVTMGASLFFSLPPLFLSVTHTLSRFSSCLKRLPKDRSKKLNRSQPSVIATTCAGSQILFRSVRKSFNQSRNAAVSFPEGLSLLNFPSKKHANYESYGVGSITAMTTACALYFVYLQPHKL